MPKTDTVLDKKIALAVLRLAAARGWKDVTLEQIAKAAKLSSAQKKQFVHKNDVLPCIVRMVTQETQAATGKPDKRAAPHDRLFDVMMTRFDVMQKNRKGLLAIFKNVPQAPDMLCKFLPTQGEAMRDMLALAGLAEEGKGPRQHLVGLGLGVVYLATLRVWQTDETLDMAKTMAALDRYLRWAGRAADIFFRVL